jgi:gliding motility-associated-like protein
MLNQLKNILLLLLVISSVGINHISAQRHSRCGANPVPLANFCADACLVCDLNGVTARTTNTIVGQAPPGFCTMVVHSMQWLAFVAGSTSLSINVSVSNCNQANGVEMGIYASDDCQTFRLVSNCNTNMYANQTWPFSTTEPLKVGCIYYLVFDGNGANSCDVSFTVTSGSTVAPVPNTTNRITGKTLVCKGTAANYTIPPIFGACSYEWRVENGSITFSKDNNATVMWDNPGKGKICVRGLNDCHTGNEMCLDVEIGDDTPLLELGPYYVCFGGTYRYNNIPLTAGTWQYFFKNRFGCDSNIVVTVDEFEPIETRMDTSVCSSDTFKIANKIYDSTGTYKVVFKSKISPFCDSVLFINLNYSKLKSIPNKTNDLNCQDTLATLFADSSLTPNTGKLFYIWTNKKNDTLGQSKSIQLSQSGEYFLTIVHQFDSIRKCISTKSIFLNGNRNIPKISILDSLKHCAGDTIFLNAILFQDLNNSNAGISIHSDISCTDSNKLTEPFLILNSDSTFYLKASNGNCVDIVRLPFEISKRDRALYPDISLCFNEEIDVGSLNFTRLGNYSGTPEIYFCAERDSNCRITNQSLSFQQDTTLYAYPVTATCPEISSFRVHVKPIPPASFSLPSDHFCYNDTIMVRMTSRDSNTNLQVKWNQMEMNVSKNISSFIVILNDSIGANTLCLMTDRLNCKDTVCQIFEVHSPPVLPVLDCIATDSTILFSWPFHKDENYQVNVVQGGTFKQLSDTSVFFENLKRGEFVKIKVHASNPWCRDLIAELECQSKTCPPVNLIINPTDTICLDASSQIEILSASTNPIQTGGHWLWRGNGIIDSINGTFDPKIAGRGNHLIQTVLDQNGCKYFGSAIIVIRDNPFADFTIDSTVCQDSTISILFKGNRADSARFNWILDGGIPKFINADRDLDIKWPTPGKKSIKLKLNNTRCNYEITKEIELFEPLDLPSIQCETTDSFITFYWNKHPRVKKYNLNLIFGNQGQRINDTMYRIHKRIYNDSASIQLLLEDTGPCSNVTSNVVYCKAPDCPPKNVIYDTSLFFCYSEPGIVSLSQFIKDGLKQFNWKGNFISNDQINTVQLLPGRYLYEITGDEFGCKYIDSLWLQINPSPEILTVRVMDIPCDPLIETGSIHLNLVNGINPPFQYSIDGINYQFSPDFLNLRSGNYRLMIKDSFGCKSDTLLQLIKPQTPDIDLGPDIEVSKGTSLNLSAIIKGKYSILQWISPVDLSCYDCPNTSATPDQTVKIYCIITNEDGCTALDSILIRVFDNKIYAPNVFSPNGDNINDVFTLFGNAVEVLTLEVYNRWGEKVFSNQNFKPNETDSGWNGRFNDRHCIPGVYVYFGIVRFENGQEMIIKGDLTLVR